MIQESEPVVATQYTIESDEKKTSTLEGAQMLRSGSSTSALREPVYFREVTRSLVDNEQSDLANYRKTIDRQWDQITRLEAKLSCSDQQLVKSEQKVLGLKARLKGQVKDYDELVEKM